MNSGSFSYHSLEASQTIQKTKYCSFIPFLLFLRPLALVDYEKNAQRLFGKIHTFMLSRYTVNRPSWGREGTDNPSHID
jgi:hypothetical protein